ncbi:hypothetical protein LTS14_001195 [Recurvomyces mirabilis]|uniref:uncharacterized protein n=1 Tax=Recurvomyces mirabilis TaxID=574656 RepID=UPI002DE02961|nr:hypothetical protein LTS14_001195 [Recurvomyces mirabilis]
MRSSLNVAFAAAAAATLTTAAPNPDLSFRAGTIPQALPDCSNTSVNPITAGELLQATFGCLSIQPTGTNFTRNDIVNAGGNNATCKPHTLLFARGTTEDANLGNVLGPPLITALEAVFLGSDLLAVQGVNNYPAIPIEYCEGGSLTGSQNLASVSLDTSNQPPCSRSTHHQQQLINTREQLIHQTHALCPSTKLIVSGYSQGAQVVHNAAQILSASDTAFISSVLLFGDPNNGYPVGSVPAKKVYVDCHVGDDICAHGDQIYEPHLSYCKDVGLAAAFALARSLV